MKGSLAVKAVELARPFSDFQHGGLISTLDPLSDIQGYKMEVYGGIWKIMEEIFRGQGRVNFEFVREAQFQAPGSSLCGCVKRCVKQPLSLDDNFSQAQRL